jgi:hypothetical protein
MGKFGEYLGLQLLESQIRYAMENTTSNLEASRWLHVSYPTWKKYASLYIDTETQLNLFELHKITGNQKRLLLPTTRYKRKAVSAHTFQPVPLTEILENKHPKFNLRIFKKRLIQEGYLAERCSCCGYQQRRTFDYEMPLKMNWKDGDRGNYSIDNVELLCFNCYFINVGNPWGSDKRAEIGEDGELRPVKWDPKKLKNQMKRVYRKKPEDGSPGSSQSNDSDITSQNS